MPVTQIRDHIVRLSRTKADPDADVEVPLATALQVLTQETAKQFSSIANTLVAHAVETPWAQPMIDAIGTDETEQPGLAGGRGYRWGKLLWLHPLFVFQSPTGSRREDAPAIAKPFRSDFYRSIDTHSGLFLPSALATRCSSGSR
jgi:hypothetical protein